jgi:hypothetical protein
MRMLLLAGALSALAAIPAGAATTLPVTSGAATGLGAVLLNEETTFDVDDTSNGPKIDSEVNVYLAIPDTSGGGPTKTDHALISLIERRNAMRENYASVPVKLLIVRSD